MSLVGLTGLDDLEVWVILVILFFPPGTSPPLSSAQDDRAGVSEYLPPLHPSHSPQLWAVSAFSKEMCHTHQIG